MEINTKYFKCFAKRKEKFFWFWVRIVDVGISIKNTPLIFSERYGFTRCYQIFGLKIGFLNKSKIKKKPDVRYSR